MHTIPMNSRNAKDTRSWYAYRWPWLLMAGPAIVVVAGLVTAWIAVTSDDGLVARENLVARLAIDRGIPLASTVGGGYGADTVALAERHVRAILTLGAAFAASGWSPSRCSRDTV